MKANQLKASLINAKLLLTFTVSFTGEFLPMYIIYGGKTVKINNLLVKLNIKVVMVPANMTNFFQSLDLIVYRFAKKLYEEVCNLVYK